MTKWQILELLVERIVDNMSVEDLVEYVSNGLGQVL